MNAEALIESAPKRVESYYYKACAEAQLGMVEEALETVRVMCKLSPDILVRLHDEFFLEPLRLQDRLEFRVNDSEEE